MDDLPTTLARFDVRTDVDVTALVDRHAARQRRRRTALAVTAAVMVALPTGWLVGGLPDTDVVGPTIAGAGTADCIPVATPAADPVELGRLSFVDDRDGRLPADVAISTDDGDRNRGEGLWVAQATCRAFDEGTTVVEGHRTVYGATLYDLPLVAAGDRIEVRPADGPRQTYVVDRIATIDADRDAAEVVPDDAGPGPHLVITTPAPAFTSGRQQLVVHASLDVAGG